MRVIAGQARGVPLVAPPGRQTRPTSDRTKEAMFAVLGDLGCEGRVLDLFAGSGALGIEALSRGADDCDFVESSPAACRALASNLAKTRLAGQGRIHRLTVERFVAAARRQGAAPYDLILLDPPYAMSHLETLLADLAGSPLVGRGTALVVEHARERTLPARLGSLVLTKTRAHGDSAFSLYLAAPEPAPAARPPAADGVPAAGSPSQPPA
jgi:16S rRNA (guanine966-N2)-methyltransferase